MTEEVYPSLRYWFYFHCVVDILFALPLLIAPAPILTFFGWTSVDPVSARLVAAALFGIGIDSFLVRGEGPEVSKNMLNLKLIWSGAAIIGLGWSLIAGTHRRPLMLWLVFVMFIAFAVLWWYYRFRIWELL
ncbi:MAG: hypothetical protein ACLFR1_12575 [Spirochaetia bacterium]